jgi:hypothetical protein
MRLPERITDSVVFLCTLDHISRTYTARGTGFWFGKLVPEPPVENPKLSFGYLVTAKHNIEKAAELGCGEIHIRVNRSSGGVQYVPIPLSDFVAHANPSIDVAVVEAPENFGFEKVSWGVPELITQDDFLERGVGLGSPIRILGLFGKHVGAERNVPVLRSGHIAALRGQPVQTRYGETDAYLVEAYSIGGLSGAPVFFSDASGYPKFLLGVLQGHFDEEPGLGLPTRGINAGIAVVTPAEKIREVLESERIQRREKQLWSDYLVRRARSG